MADLPAARNAHSRQGGLPLDHEAYETLADFRYLIRRFLAFSQSAAITAELTSRQHQALLAIKGFSGEGPPTVGDLADRLCIRHHSAVELVNRLAEGGLIERCSDPHDRRRVLLRLTAAADQRLAELATVHLEELRRLRPALAEILDRIETEPRVSHQLPRDGFPRNGQG